MRHQQQGLTLIGMILTMLMVVIAGLLVLRVLPVYIEQYEVVSSLKALTTIPQTEFSSDPSVTADLLRSKLLNQLYINSIESISSDHISIVPDGHGHLNITVKYQVIKPLIANVRLLFDFEASQEVTISAE